jgi:hypothetical protein
LVAVLVFLAGAAEVRVRGVVEAAVDAFTRRVGVSPEAEERFAAPRFAVVFEAARAGCLARGGGVDAAAAVREEALGSLARGGGVDAAAVREEGRGSLAREGGVDAAAAVRDEGRGSLARGGGVDAAAAVRDEARGSFILLLGVGADGGGLSRSAVSSADLDALAALPPGAAHAPPKSAASSRANCGTY